MEYLRWVLAMFGRGRDSDMLIERPTCVASEGKAEEATLSVRGVGLPWLGLLLWVSGTDAGICMETACLKSFLPGFGRLPLVEVAAFGWLLWGDWSGSGLVGLEMSVEDLEGLLSTATHCLDLR